MLPFFSAERARTWKKYPKRTKTNNMHPDDLIQNTSGGKHVGQVHYGVLGTAAPPRVSLSRSQAPNRPEGKQARFHHEKPADPAKSRKGPRRPPSAAIGQTSGSPAGRAQGDPAGAPRFSFIPHPAGPRSERKQPHSAASRICGHPPSIPHRLAQGGH